MYPSLLFNSPAAASVAAAAADDGTAQHSSRCCSSSQQCPRKGCKVHSASRLYHVSRTETRYLARPCVVINVYRLVNSSEVI